MKPLNQNELFQHLQGFLKAKGIELQEGSYTRGIQKSCTLLSDAINLGQQGLDRAKSGIDKKLDQMRQVIHEKTAPRKPAANATAAAGPSKPKTGAAEPKATRSRPHSRRGSKTKK